MVIKGAIIDGDLSLEGLGRPSDPMPTLDLSDCAIRGKLDLSSSAWMSVRLDRCRLRGLTGRRLNVVDGLSANDLTFETTGPTEISLEGMEAGFLVSLSELGRRSLRPPEAAPDAPKAACYIDLSRCRIRDALLLSGAHLSNPGGTALDLDKAEIAGNVLLRRSRHRFASRGTVFIISAQIGGQFDATGACMLNPGEDAIAANGVNLRGHFLLERAKVRGCVDLNNAQCGGLLNFSASDLANPGGLALTLDRCDVASHIQLFQTAAGRFRCRGAISMAGAQVGGNVNFSGARLRYSKGYALSMTNCHVAGDVSLCATAKARFEARGGVQLIRARIDGLLDCEGARLVTANRTRSALSADATEIGRGLFLRVDHGFRVETRGEIRLLGSTIGGNLECSGARLKNRRGNALLLDQAEISGGLYLQPHRQEHPFDALGVISLVGATVTGTMTCIGTFLNPRMARDANAVALNVESARIGVLQVQLTGNSAGRVLLAGARVDGLNDNGGYGWGPEPRPTPDGRGVTGVVLRMDGFTYERLGPWTPERARGWRVFTWPVLRAIGFGTPQDRWWHRTKWLDRQCAGNKPVPDDFFPQPHEQLAKVLRSQGHDYDARRIMNHKFEHEGRCGADEMVARFFMWLYRMGFGCGYLPIRAFITVVVWWMIGWAGVTYALELNTPTEALFVRTTTGINVVRTLSKPDEAPANPADRLPYPSFKTREIACDDEEISPVLYALDTIVPVFQLHMDAKCEFSGDTERGRLWRHIKAVYALFGWIIVTLAALTWTGVLRREPS
jgi:hypothetical protein